MLFERFTKSLLVSIRRKNYAFFGENGLVDVCMDEDVCPKECEAYYLAK